METPSAGGTPRLCAQIGADAAVRFRRSDPAAFREIYEAHAGRVYGLALRMAGCPHRAEDLTQEVFLRAWAKRGTLREPAAIGAWISRLAANLVASRMRREVRRREREPALLTVEAVADPRPSERGATAIDLDRAIARLPASARAVFVLHDIEGYTHQEIGTMVGIAAGTSKAHLHRARALLRRELER